jgi:hypothetical protein
MRGVGTLFGLVVLVCSLVCSSCTQDFDKFSVKTTSRKGGDSKEPALDAGNSTAQEGTAATGKGGAEAGAVDTADRNTDETSATDSETAADDDDSTSSPVSTGDTSQAGETDAKAATSVMDSEGPGDAGIGSDASQPPDSQTVTENTEPDSGTDEGAEQQPVVQADAGEAGAEAAAPACPVGPMCDADRQTCELVCSRDQDECELTCAGNPGECRRACRDDFDLCALDCTRNCDDCYMAAGCASACDG